MLNLNSRHDVVHAALNNRGGRNTKNTTSGGSGIRGRRGTSDAPRPTNTSTIGYDSEYRRATPLIAATAISSASNSSSSVWMGVMLPNMPSG